MTRLRTLLRLDAALEAVLAVVSLLFIGRPSVPNWIGSPALIVFALLLVFVAIALW
jgi:hypothetical protein